MGILTFLLVAVGVFLGSLLVVAVLVAGWELLRQRELEMQLLRDRAAFAATSPLPLASSPAQEAGAAFARLTSIRAAAGSPSNASTGPAAAPTRREPGWIETKPMILSARAALSDNGNSAHGAREADEAHEAETAGQELDLVLD